MMLVRRLLAWLLERIATGTGWLARKVAPPQEK